MGKHYCDYCDVFLTHDSVSVRKAHNSGRNHLQNVREYYQSLDPDQIQQVLDTLAKEYDRRGIEKPRDLLQPAGSSFMTFGAGPLSGTSDRAFRSQGPQSMSMGGGGSSRGIGGGSGGDWSSGGSRGGPGGHGRYGGNDGSSRDHGPPPNYNRPPPQGGPYPRPPPNMMGGGAPGGSNGSYPPRGPPPGYGAPTPAPYANGPLPPNMRGPPPSGPPNGSYTQQSRSGYGQR
ncbi:related to U1 small nuclear ribonucleoprotein C [Ustilago sp. UG-2017b]|nr:related to U1 small nuclear ribonucleoprotein C [Ustilago sp. UG-2017b]